MCVPHNSNVIYAFLSLLRWHVNSIDSRIHILHVQRMCRKAWWLFPPTVWLLEWLYASSDLPVQVVVLTHLKQMWGPFRTCRSSEKWHTIGHCCHASFSADCIFGRSPCIRIHWGLPVNPVVKRWSSGPLTLFGICCRLLSHFVKHCAFC